MSGNHESNLYSTDKIGDFQVLSVPDIGMLENIGVRNGTQISVEHRYSLGGPVLLRVEGAYTVALGKDIAKHITVRETDDTVADAAVTDVIETEASEVKTGETI